MRLGIKNRFKKGATSFYIVAFSTLILLIVATSFAAIIISEIERTSNDDLSQSAYDSALAGVEDAKLAFYSYQNCVAQGTSANLDCKAVMNYMANPDCDMVGHILGRTAADTKGEVIVQESSSGNNMQQAYTCVKVDTVLDDYRSTLSSATQYKVVKLKFDKLDASQIKRVKVSWYADRDAKTFKYTNFASNKVVFPKTGTALWATPPTISVAVVQTAKTFTYDQFSTTVGNTTNRGMVYLTPVRTTAQASSSTAGNHKGAYDASSWHEGTHNYINANGLLDSNKKTSANTNVPYAVYCDPNGGSDFACSATIEIPSPVGGARSNDTFLMVVAMPYGKPTTDFALEFFCDTQCTTNTYKDAAGNTVEQKTNQANLNGVQVGVDSTGRANDLYRRIETRLESAANDANLTVMGPLELTGSSSGGGSGSGGYTLQKTMTVKCENNFIGRSNCL